MTDTSALELLESRIEAHERRLAFLHTTRETLTGADPYTADALISRYERVMALQQRLLNLLRRDLPNGLTLQ
jgi:hypothetical protein